MSMMDPYGGGYGIDPYGLPPELIAQLIGQQYNPSQGYPLKQVSDQAWDYYGPTPDYLIAQQASFMTPNREDFSTDSFFAAQPLVRGGLAEALAHGKGDSIEAYNYLQGDDYQKRLRQEIGRTEWDDLVQQGDLRSIAAVGSEERDQAGVDFYNKALEEALTGGAPTSARNQAQWDAIAERMGGRTYPGAGQIVGQDPMAGLAGGGPDYGGIDYDATREGAAPEFEDLGEATGPEYFGQGADGRYAVVDGRRYRINEDSNLGGSSNPHYNQQLRRVLQERGQRVGNRRRARNDPNNSNNSAWYDAISRQLSGGAERVQRGLDWVNPFN